MEYSATNLSKCTVTLIHKLFRHSHKGIRTEILQVTWYDMMEECSKGHLKRNYSILHDTTGSSYLIRLLAVLCYAQFCTPPENIHISFLSVLSCYILLKGFQLCVKTITDIVYCVDPCGKNS